eukprot:CFRG2382T1
MPVESIQTDAVVEDTKEIVEDTSSEVVGNKNSDHKNNTSTGSNDINKKRKIECKGASKSVKTDAGCLYGDGRPDEPIVDSSGYCFVVLNDLPKLRLAIQLFHTEKTPLLRGTILLAPEGVNIRLSGYASDVEAMKRCFERVSDNAIANVHYKDMEMDRTNELDNKLSITRFLVKLKKEVISMGVAEANPSVTQTPANHLEPKELKKWLDEGRDLLLLDTRNDYEVVLGTFKGAQHFNIHTFREFPQAVRESELLKEIKRENDARKGKKKDVVMFCTGGVRCEKAAFCLKEAGFETENLYQLNGGILHYLQEILPLAIDSTTNENYQTKPVISVSETKSIEDTGEETNTKHSGNVKSTEVRDVTNEGSGTGAPGLNEETCKMIESRTHYEGECFVFDDRVSVRGVDLKVAGSVLCGSCLHPFSKVQQERMKAMGDNMICPSCGVEDVLGISRPARC